MKILYLSLFFVLIILISLNSENFFVNADDAIMCPKLENSVHIDGKWTSNKEWSDSLEKQLKFVSGDGEAYIRMKHDEESLYLLIDYVSLKSPQERDAVGFMVDTHNDGGIIMQKDDYFLGNIYLSGENAWTVRVWGTGSKILTDLSDLNWELISELDLELEPEGFLVHSSNDAENDPYSNESHMMWEFEIPKSEFESEKIRFLSFVINIKDEKGASYPFIGLDKADDPSSWAKVEFSSSTLTELTAKPVTTTTTNMTDLPKSKSDTSTKTIPTPTSSTITYEQRTTQENSSNEKNISKLIGSFYIEYLIIGLLFIIIILLIFIIRRERRQNSQE